MAAISVVVDPASLRRGATGAVTGMLVLRADSVEFPARSWGDFPVVVLAWWVRGLFELSSGEARTFQGLFMEGPYAFTLRTGVGGMAEVAWGHREKQLSVGVVPVHELLESVVRAGSAVARACRAQGWDGSDLSHLEEALARASV